MSGSIIGSKKKFRKRQIAKREAVADQAIEKLTDALQARAEGQKLLIQDMKAELYKYYKVGARSEFIPSDYPERSSAVAHIEREFADRLKEFRVKITSDFKFICT